MTRKVTTTMEDDLYRIIKEKGIKLSECLAKGAEIILDELKHGEELPIPSSHRIKLTRATLSSMTDVEVKMFVSLIRKRGFNATVRTEVYGHIERKIGLPLNARSRQEVQAFIDRLYKKAQEEGELSYTLDSVVREEKVKLVPIIDKFVKEAYPNIEGKFLRPSTISSLAYSIVRKISTFFSERDISNIIGIKYGPWYSDPDRLSIADVERLTIA